jgi:hypothetical protein
LRGVFDKFWSAAHTLVSYILGDMIIDKVERGIEKPKCVKEIRMMQHTRSSLFSMVLCVICGTMILSNSARAVERPFILWDKKDIASIRKKIESEAWARTAYEKLVNSPERSEQAFSNLFQHAIMGDKEAAERDKKELMRMVKSPIPRGAAQYINVIRYDLLYDTLTGDERKEIEEAFGIYIDNQIFKRAILDPNIFNDSRNFSRYDARTYTRTNWLPNIIWPWKDEELIRKVWAAYGSWKWYFDEYLCDIGFYSEEFGKMGSTPGAMLLYCRALERLGLDELGYGYKGKGGATMRGHIESLIHLGYPRVDVGSERYHYPMLTIGDLRQSGSSQSWNLPSPAFQYSIVMGYTPDGMGGNVRWKAHGAWGGVIRGNHAQWDGYSGFTPKMQIPYWFEIGHALWPETGFDYFLAQMRKPNEDKYYPSLFFGLDPIDPEKVKAPPAPSAVWPERGLVMLRVDESPAYWESASPAIAMRLATNYAHNVIDCFSLSGFYAFNRPIYLNRQVTPDYAEDWSRSIQSHCGVTVDGEEPKFTSETMIRQAFTKPVKFVASRSGSVFEGVDLTRSLMLTNEYCLDVTRLESTKEHSYYWLIHALGQIQPEAQKDWKLSAYPKVLRPLKKVRACNVGNRPWSVTALQSCALDEPSKAKLPRQWYERKIGVRLQMLGGDDTTAYTAETPLVVSRFRDEKGQQRDEEMPSEVGGVTIAAERKGPSTTFVALHEAFEGGKSNIYEFRTIKQTDEGVAVSVVGKYDTGIDDRLMLRVGNEHEQPITLSDGRDSFTFADWAYLRISEDKVEVWGDMRILRIAVYGQPKLLVNGKEEKALFMRGYLYYCKLPQ